jgi:hypothetical protein
MNKLSSLLIILIALLFSGCSETKYIKEVISSKEVAISMRGEYPKNQYLVLLIPLEFELNLNNSKILRVTDRYSKDNNYMFPGEDYIFINGDNDKIMYTFDKFTPYNYPKKLVLLERKNIVSKEQAKELIKQYNPKASLENIKSKRDTIKLISYSQYRKDNPQFLEEMRIIPDTLVLRINKKGKSETVVEKIKINW